jgi:bifunctional DNA-binding transcriptional regulator/antitoxin component of YhaV-PrlF toxin-antitoxin module
MTILQVDASGRVQFPEALRQELGLTNTAQLSLVVRDGEIILVPLTPPTTTITETAEPNVYYKGHVLVVETRLGNEIDAAIVQIPQSFD